MTKGTPSRSTPRRMRWKSDKFEVEQGEGSPFYWFMPITNRECRLALTQTELKELRDLLTQALQESAP